MSLKFRVTVVGTGPSALIAADVLSGHPQVSVTLIEKRRSPGRKILIAGSSGLNISNGLPTPEFAKAYSGSMSSGFWSELLTQFGQSEWIEFVEKKLGRETFLGTSGRYFTKEMKGSKLLRAWLDRLERRSVQLRRGVECTDFSNEEIVLSDGSILPHDALILALGGASYEPFENPLRWVSIFDAKQIRVDPFVSSNVGYRVSSTQWTETLLAEAEGKPLKNILLKTSKGEKRGELVITRYGLEGTPIYTVGAEGWAEMDLKPTQSFEELHQRCLQVRENLSPIRRIKKQLALPDASFALLFHLTSPTERNSLETLIRRIKSLPIHLTQAQPLTEAISSAGGVHFTELQEATLQLQKQPRVFCAGEMLDWDAPTGGFLIQGAVSTGWRAAHSVLQLLQLGDSLPLET